MPGNESRASTIPASIGAQEQSTPAVAVSATSEVSKMTEVFVSCDSAPTTLPSKTKTPTPKVTARGKKKRRFTTYFYFREICDN